MYLAELFRTIALTNFPSFLYYILLLTATVHALYKFLLID